MEEIILNIPIHSSSCRHIDCILQPSLQEDTSVWLGFSQWNMSESDTHNCNFWPLTNSCSKFSRVFPPSYQLDVNSAWYKCQSLHPLDPWIIRWNRLFPTTHSLCHLSWNKLGLCLRHILYALCFFFLTSQKSVKFAKSQKNC